MLVFTKLNITYVYGIIPVRVDQLFYLLWFCTLSIIFFPELSACKLTYLTKDNTEETKQIIVHLHLDIYPTDSHPVYTVVYARQKKAAKI